VRLIIFARFPQAGQVKTRLVPALGPERAAQLHRYMTEDCVSRLVPDGCQQSEICFDGGDEPSMQDWLGRELSYVPQGPGDLGQRMLRAFRRAFDEGHRRAVLVGTDIPALEAAHIRQAGELLEQHQLVLGPAADGGYYLIGLRQTHPELFAGISWGSSEVLHQTMAKASALGLSIAQLPELADVDRPEDLALHSKLWQFTRI